MLAISSSYFLVSKLLAGSAFSCSLVNGELFLIVQYFYGLSSFKKLPKWLNLWKIIGLGQNNVVTFWEFIYPGSAQKPVFGASDFWLLAISYLVN